MTMEKHTLPFRGGELVIERTAPDHLTVYTSRSIYWGMSKLDFTQHLTPVESAVRGEAYKVKIWAPVTTIRHRVVAGVLQEPTPTQRRAIDRIIQNEVWPLVKEHALIEETP